MNTPAVHMTTCCNQRSFKYNLWSNPQVIFFIYIIAYKYLILFKLEVIIIEYKLENFYNDYTLNIFSDGSYNKSYNKGSSVYGVIAINKDYIVNSQVVKTDDTNINMAELKGIRSSLSMARSYLNIYKYINIFSDSKTSIDKVLKFYNNPNKDTSNQVIKQIREIYKYIDENKNTIVTILYCPSHVDPSFFRRSFNSSIEKFKKNNNIDKCDTRLFSYIARGNDLVDRLCTMYRKYDYNSQKTICPMDII